MPKVVLTSIFFSMLIAATGQSQLSTQSSAILEYTYRSPTADKESWQRLNLLLSSTFIVVVKEGQVNADTCLYIASRSLGLSRISVLAEGINDPELYKQSQWIDNRQPGTGVQLLSKATGKRRLQLLLLLGSYYAFEPDSYYRYSDSVKYYLTKAVNESKSLNEERIGRQALCLLGKIYLQGNDKKSDSIYNILLAQCEKVGDKETEVRALAYRGIYTLPTPSTFQEKIADLEKAADLYQSLGDVEGEINVFTDLGYMFTVAGQLQTAEEILLKALRLEEEIHYPYTQYNTDALAMVGVFQSKFGEPLKYTIQTVKVAESTRDSIAWGYFYLRMQQLLNSEGRQKEALEMGRRALNRFVINHDPAAYKALHEIILNKPEKAGHGEIREMLKLALDISQKVNAPKTFSEQFEYHSTLSSCYLDLKKLDSAEIHIKKMDSLESKAEAIRGPLRRSLVTDYYGILFFERGQYRKAKEYFEKHFTALSIGSRSIWLDLNTYRWLIMVDSALRDNASEIVHYTKYVELLDSSFNVTKVRQAEELQVMYQTREKENQITSLLQQAKLEKANLEQAAHVKKLTLAGIIAALVIVGLLYRQNRLRQKNNRQLQQLLGDKEWLLKEIHHRVKNNLQIIMSLLNAQSVFIDNDAALSAINKSQQRVHAIALIHQRLYQSENISAIAMPGYINELVSHLSESFDIGTRIIFEKKIESLDLDVAKAVPLGLIINEGLVNAIKYAFPSGRKGVVAIALKHDGADNLLLSIQDNGIGLPAGLDIRQLNSLGLDLMQGLAKQLRGSFNIENSTGVHIIVRFANN